MKKVSIYESNGKQFATAKEAKHFDNLNKLLNSVINQFSGGDMTIDALQEILDKWAEITKPTPRVSKKATPEVAVEHVAVAEEDVHLTNAARFIQV